MSIATGDLLCLGMASAFGLVFYLSLQAQRLETKLRDVEARLASLARDFKKAGDK